MEPGTAREPRDEEVPTIAGLPIRDIGMLPEVARRIHTMAEDPATRAEDVARVIVRDPALTSMVLRIVNSSFYGLRREVRGLGHAIAYLGIHQIRNLVMSSAIVNAFQFNHGIVEPKSVWQHALGCAIAAKKLGDPIPAIDGDGCYLGGLLHDVGRMAFLSAFAQDYADVIETCERGLCALGDAEASRFDVSHEEAGEILGRAWGFSEPVVAIVRHHHGPDAAGEHAAMAAVVAIADATCHVGGLGFGFELDRERAEDSMDGHWDSLRRALGDTCPDRDAVQPELIETMRQARGSIEALFNG